MKIYVKRKHIKEGRHCSFEKCPVALALKEQNGLSWCVDEDGISLDYSNCKVIKSPRSVKRFIRRFDFGDSVKPFNFIFNP